MTKLRLVLLSLLAAVAVSAVGSASAFAECSKKAPELKCTWDVNGAEVTKDTAVKLKGGLQVLLAKNANVETDCKEVKATATLKLAGANSAPSITYTGCTVIKPLATCTINSVGAAAGTIVTKAVTSQLKESTPGSGKPVVTITPSEKIEGELAFVELELKEKGGGKCSTAPEKTRVTGTITGTVNNTAPGKLEFVKATGLNAFGVAATLTGNLEPEAGTTIAAL